jgi:hypothetical protein
MCVPFATVNTHVSYSHNHRSFFSLPLPTRHPFTIQSPVYASEDSILPPDNISIMAPNDLADQLPALMPTCSFDFQHILVTQKTDHGCDHLTGPHGLSVNTATAIAHQPHALVLVAWSCDFMGPGSLHGFICDLQSYQPSWPSLGYSTVFGGFLTGFLMIRG